MRYINEKDLKGLKSIDYTISDVFLQNGQRIHSFGGWKTNVEIIPHYKHKQVQSNLYLNITISNIDANIFMKALQHFDKEFKEYETRIKSFTDTNIETSNLSLKINIEGIFYNTIAKQFYHGCLIKCPLVKFIDMKDSNIRDCKTIIFKLEESDDEYNELIKLNKQWQENFMQYNQYK